MHMKPDKLCPDCGRRLPRSAFGVKGRSKVNGKPYLTTRCKDCHNPHRRKNPKNAEYHRRWVEKHREQFNEYMRQWRKDHAPSVAARRESYRLREGYSELPEPSIEVWQQTLEFFNHSCAYCGSDKKIEIDHFYPLNKGGRATIDNLVPACRLCNRRKRDTHPNLFLSPDVYDRVSSYLASLMV